MIVNEKQVETDRANAQCTRWILQRVSTALIFTIKFNVVQSMLDRFTGAHSEATVLVQHGVANDQAPCQRKTEESDAHPREQDVFVS